MQNKQELTNTPTQKGEGMKTFSEILYLLGDAWVEAEVATGETPNRRFRLDYFTRLEQKLHDSGIKCDIPNCGRHK